ncbi:MAG: DinB family protein [Candidatus Tectimicrobiota bacterium]
MPAFEGLLTALERNWEMVDATLAPLDEAIMARRPTEQCNSIAWILWHMTRVVDTFIHTRLRAQAQLWIKDGWAGQFGMPADPDERGVGWTAAQVVNWSAPARSVQLGYYEALKQATRTYLRSLSDADLEVRRVIPPVPEPRSVAAALGQMTWDNVAHGGQIAYLRGLFQGMGWYDR